MKIIKMKSAVDAQGRLFLDVPVALEPGPVEVVMVIQSEPERSSIPPRYDFTDLVGKLTWQGDALATQKALRDEWI